MMMIRILLLFLTIAQRAGARPRVAVCFFGITRSLRTTAPMIHQRILEPLRSVADVKIFLHTYNLSTFTNSRSKEFNVTNNHLDLHLLRPDVYMVDDQLAFLNTIDGNFCRKNGDPWRDNFQSHRNFMCQLNSLYQVTKILLADGNFSAVVYARPDVFYFTAIDAQQVLGARQNTIYVPPFHNWDGTNDRFAFGQLNVMQLYGTRFRDIHQYCKTNPAHAERFLRWYLLQENIAIRRTPMLFGRVRVPNVLWERPVWLMDHIGGEATALEAMIENYS